MTITRILGMLGKLPKSARRKVSGKILPEKEFHWALERERSRASRSGLVFSVALFEIGRSDQVLLGRMAAVLGDRLRSTDEVGWVDDTRLGVLLYNAVKEQAILWAESISFALASEGIPLQFSVRTFPEFIAMGERLKVVAGGASRGAGLTAPADASSPPSPPSAASEPDPATMQDQQGVLAEAQPFFPVQIPVWKRTLDFSVALLMLVVLSPLFLLISLYIKAVSPGPVLYKQQRVGRGGRLFTLLKFRSMAVNTDHRIHQEYLKELIHGGEDNDSKPKPMLKLDGRDPQIIPLGKVLRKTCMDELPQLFNVLRGEMSLIGPRPPLPYEVREYRLWHKERFDALPGMTGLWQVCGKNRLTFREMIRLDIRYAKRLSFPLDLIILLRTPLAILDQIWGGLTKKKDNPNGA